jgi:hypothetical protein
MRVLVCGGRTYWPQAPVYEALAAAGANHVLAGGATGADDSAVQWALGVCAAATKHSFIATRATLKSVCRADS